MNKENNSLLKGRKSYVLFLLISIFFVSESVASPLYSAKTYAQQKEFTVQVNDQTVKEVLASLVST